MLEVACLGALGQPGKAIIAERQLTSRPGDRVRKLENAALNVPGGQRTYAVNALLTTQTGYTDLETDSILMALSNERSKAAASSSEV